MSNLVHQRLMQQLGYTFQDESLFLRALTHRSCGADNNERLEFLGDSLLNTIIAEALFQQFPKAKEGQMSRLRSQLVKGETLAQIGREMALGNSLTLGEGELKSGGHRRASILADAVEALIAAIYLDSGFITCRTTVLAWYHTRLQNLSLDRVNKDPKSALQEWLQARGQPLPDYQLVEVDGQAHAQTFTVQCRVSQLSEPVVVQGTNRREAEKMAAKQALERLNAHE